MSTLSTLFLALTAHTDVLTRAQGEIDKVIGRSRWPTFADYEQLPYVVALVREVCRWRPVAPLSVPHASTKDDIYDGWFIPKGTTVISAIWYRENFPYCLRSFTDSPRRSIHHDPLVYPEPESFKPERFLSETGTLIGTEESKERGHHMFGFGRRCVFVLCAVYPGLQSSVIAGS